MTTIRIPTKLFDVEQVQDTLVLTPRENLRELCFGQIEDDALSLVPLADDPTVRHLVVDFGRTRYFGSTALGLLLRLGDHVSRHGGRMALCNVCPEERDILVAAGMADLWPIHGSRDEALRAVNLG